MFQDFQVGVSTQLFIFEAEWLQTSVSAIKWTKKNIVSQLTVYERVVTSLDGFPTHDQDLSVRRG